VIFRMRCAWCAIAAAALALPGALAAASKRTQHITLRAPWPTSYLNPVAEAVEYFAQELASPRLLWDFVEAARGSSGSLAAAAEAATSNSTSSSIEAATDAALDTVESTALKPHSRLVSLSLELRAHAAAIESDRVLAAASAAACGVQDTHLAADGTAAAWAVITPANVAVCSPAALTAALQQQCTDAECVALGSSDSSTYPHDHFYHAAASTTTAAAADVTVIVYGAVGTQAFYSLHDIASAAAEQGQAAYVLRHALPYPAEHSLPFTALQGWGVFLDIKNMEYKNFDSESAAGTGATAAADTDAADAGAAAANSADTIDASEDVAGLNFAVLLARAPQLSAELRVLRTSLLAEAAAEAEHEEADSSLKVWSLRDLGLQAVHSIAAAAEPLCRMEELSQNFPARAGALSAVKVQPELREEAVAVVSLTRQLGLQSGVLYVNGVPLTFAGGVVNVFQALEHVRSARSSMQQLSTLAAAAVTAAAAAADTSSSSSSDSNSSSDSVSDSESSSNTDSSSVTRLLQSTAPPAAEQSASAGGSSVHRVEAMKGAAANRDGGIVYLNNLEQDAMYTRWPDALQQLLQPSHQLHSLRKNLVTLLLVLDPLGDSSSGDATATAAAAGTLQLAVAIAAQLPIRVGLVLTSEADVAAHRSGLWQLTDNAVQHNSNSPASSRDIAELAAAAARKPHGSSAAVQQFIGRTGELLAAHGSLTRDHLVAVFVEAVLQSASRSRSPVTRETVQQLQTAAWTLLKDSTAGGFGYARCVDTCTTQCLILFTQDCKPSQCSLHAIVQCVCTVCIHSNFTIFFVMHYLSCLVLLKYAERCLQPC
jgi:Thioredoxin-like domain